MFGMNLSNGLAENSGLFWWVTGFAGFMGILLLGGFVTWVRYKGLMFIPDPYKLQLKKKPGRQ